MRVKVPQKIGDFRVVYDSKLLLDESVYAQVWWRRELIKLDPCMPDNNKTRSLFHEQFHLIDKEYKLHLDEDTIDRLANGMYQFIRYNLGIEFDWSDIKEL